MNGHDVRVRKAGGGFRLPQKAQPDLLAERELRRKHLDRHLTLQPLVASAEDDAHPAPTDLSLESVGAAERLT